MKKVLAISALVAILLSMVLFGCDPNWSVLNLQKGSLAISLPGSRVAQSGSRSISAETTEYSFKIELDSADGQYSSSQWYFGGQTVIISDLTPGQYSIAVYAYSSADYGNSSAPLIYNGFSIVEVVVGQFANVQIQLTAANGGLIIEILLPNPSTTSTTATSIAYSTLPSGAIVNFNFDNLESASSINGFGVWPEDYISGSLVELPNKNGKSLKLNGLPTAYQNYGWAWSLAITDRFSDNQVEVSFKYMTKNSDLSSAGFGIGFMPTDGQYSFEEEGGFIYSSINHLSTVPGTVVEIEDNVWKSASFIVDLGYFSNSIVSGNFQQLQMVFSLDGIIELYIDDISMKGLSSSTNSTSSTIANGSNNGIIDFEGISSIDQLDTAGTISINNNPEAIVVSFPVANGSTVLELQTDASTSYFWTKLNFGLQNNELINVEFDYQIVSISENVHPNNDVLAFDIHSQTLDNFTKLSLSGNQAQAGLGGWHKGYLSLQISTGSETPLVFFTVVSGAEMVLRVDNIIVSK